MAKDSDSTRSTSWRSRCIVSKQYGIQLRADNQENERIFRSLRNFAQYVAEQRIK